MSDSRLASFFVIIMAAATGFLGPGSFSLDCHLFGRREIIIPRRAFAEILTVPSFSIS
ncbi:MAG: hypothetical protein L0387_28960 [Acidobacteria bacterium]|nr:hypothetical protein [Acidobacteriota bacterium]MCI0625628.1 hypothetical protein [Acidobacteriota bacterium]